MNPTLRFILGRLIAIPISLVVITAVLYAIVMMAPPEDRAMLYFPPNTRTNMPPQLVEATIRKIIDEHGLDDPYPQQYARWLGNLLRGNWGWSPTFNADVLELLQKRTPATLELTLWSLIAMIPAALLLGTMAGWREGGRFDSAYRFTAFLGTSIPPFILGLFLISIFYVGLDWFPLGRTSMRELYYSTSTFQHYTGLLTVDGLLNGRLDVTIDALRHLVLPVFTVSLLYWATVSRVTRVAVIEERNKDYIAAARSRGLRRRSIVGRHALRNAVLPALTTTILSAAALVTGVFIVEVIFDLNGLSELLVRGMSGLPDAPLTLGFAVYSVMLIIPIMMLLDITRGLVDPRIRDEDL